MALIGAAFALGFTVGPVLGGVALLAGGEAATSPWPGFLAAGLSGVALLLAIFRLPESLTRDSESAARSLFDRAALRGAFAAVDWPAARDVVCGRVFLRQLRIDLVAGNRTDDRRRSLGRPGSGNGSGARTRARGDQCRAAGAGDGDSLGALAAIVSARREPGLRARRGHDLVHRAGHFHVPGDDSHARSRVSRATPLGPAFRGRDGHRRRGDGDRRFLRSWPWRPSAAISACSWKQWPWRSSASRS